MDSRVVVRTRSWRTLLAVPILFVTIFDRPTAGAPVSETAQLEQQIERDRAFAEKRRRQEQQWRARAANARQRAGDAQREVDRDSLLDDAKTYDMRAAQATQDAEEAEASAARAEAQLQEIAKQRPAAAPETAPERHPPPAEPLTSGGSKRDPMASAAIPLEQTIGVWRVAGTDGTFAIVPEEPDLPVHAYKLEAHTGDRVWKGEYSHFEAGDVRRMQDARAVFKYTPRAEEMNPEIPDWARRQIEGELEWQIELDEDGSCGSPVLSGHLFPGEIRWPERDGDGPVTVKGRGSPRPLVLERGPALELDMIGRPSIVVSLGGKHDPLTRPIEGLTKRQRFFVRVSLPKEMAEKQGDTLKVTIKGRRSRETDTITLTAGGTRKNRASVNYAHTDPATIADSTDTREQDREATFLSWQWWTDSATGARLDLDAMNGEEIEFRFGDVFEVIPVYDSWVQRNIERMTAGAARLRAAFEATRGDPALFLTNGEPAGVPAERLQTIRAEADARIQMLHNLQTMLDSGYLSDVHKHELLMLYLGEGPGFQGSEILREREMGLARGSGVRPENSEAGQQYAGRAGHQRTGSRERVGIVFAGPEATDERERKRREDFIGDKRSSTSAGVDLLRSFSEGLTGRDLSSKVSKSYENVKWVSHGERVFARKTLRQASNTLAERITKELGPALALGMYDGVVMASGMGDLYLASTGDDHFGRKRPWTDRVLAAVGLVSGSVLQIAGPTAWRHFQGGNIAVTFGGAGSPLKFRRNRLGAPVKQKRRFGGDHRPLYPETLNPGQRARVRMEAPPVSQPPAGRASTPGRAQPAAAAGADGPSCIPARDPELIDMGELDARRKRAQAKLPRDIRGGQHFYGPNHRFVDAPETGLFPEQIMQTCNLHVVLHGLWKRTGKTITTIRAYEQMIQAGILETKHLTYTKNPLRRAFSHRRVRRYANLLGAQTFELPYRRNAHITLEELSSMLDGGFVLTNVLAIGDANAIIAARRKAAQHGVGSLTGPQSPRYHAVEPVEFVRNQKGSIVSVKYYDPAFGRIGELPACVYRNRLAVLPTYGNTVLFQWGD